jgi:small subunit ribosomal protein S13
VWNHNLPPQKAVAVSTDRRHAIRSCALAIRIVCSRQHLPVRCLQWAFASLYGIGKTQSFRLCGDLGLNPFQKLGAIPDADFEGIKAKIETTFEPKHAVLKRQGDNILAKVRMGSYQGLRHQMCLPVHGQRTRSNANTQRKLGKARAALFNIPLLSKKAKQSANAGGAPAGGGGAAKPAAAAAPAAAPAA